MNLTRIEWVHPPNDIYVHIDPKKRKDCFTWNPVVGCSGLGCAVFNECYARRTAKRFKQKCQLCYDFKPHLHAERLNQPYDAKRPSGIFVCSMADIFDPKLPAKDKAKVFKVLEDISWKHRIYILTKQADNLRSYSFGGWGVMLSRCWIGVTVNRKSDLWRIDDLRHVQAKVRFVSFEPLKENLGDVNLDGIQWIIIGGETRNGKTVYLPDTDHVFPILDKAEALGIPVFLKNNLNPTGCSDYDISQQQFPKELP